VKMDKSISRPKEANEILALMENQKPYLNPELDLSMLSKQVNINSKVTSYILNHELKTNFYEFVNKYRVEEFKNRVRQKDSEKFSLLGLAYECGFNSKSTFNLVFKKFTGQTPKKYYIQGKNKS
jgi:AraC-like DNA-binding protein